MGMLFSCPYATVEMACGKCVSNVEAAVADVPGVDSVVASLGKALYNTSPPLSLF